MNKNIVHFLEQQTCATICCTDEFYKPYCFSCFYAYNFEEGLLYFKSSATSHHSSLMRKNPFIAGTVLPDKLSKLSVKGIQFEGLVLDAEDPLMKAALANYLKQHPIALAIPGEIWAIQINHIKMTDSTLGFGKKIAWSRDEINSIVV
jgi:uncharacterized protein YhbP (UPF0306 family)